MRGRQLLIRTPEGVTFAYELAGPIARFLAWSLDMGCIVVASIVLNASMGLISALAADAAHAIGTIAFFVMQMGYPMFAEWKWRGQTIGKRVLKIRVIDGEGLHLQPSQVVLRNIVRAVDALPFFYAVGGAACLFSPRAQRLGDIVANTIVIQHETARDPEIEQLLRIKYNSLRAYPHLTARLRQKCTPDEAAIAVNAIVRSESLEPRARVELFDRIADHFRDMVAFPPEAVDGLSSEQYVHDVVQVLYETKLRARS